MSVLLPDLRTAVQTYLNTQVTCSVPAIVPGNPGTLNPGDTFTYSVKATNGNVPLTNVRYHVRVANPAVAQIFAPPAAVATASTGGSLGVAISPGAAAPAGGMFLTPAGTDLPRLDAGETDQITGLTGKALALGTLDLRVQILGDPDLNWLFPKNEDSPEVSKTMAIV